MDWLSWKLRRHPNTYPDDEADYTCNSWTEYLVPVCVIAIFIPIVSCAGIDWPDEYVANTTKIVGAEHLRDHATYGIFIFLPLIVACIAYRVLCLVPSVIAMVVHLIFSAVVPVFVVLCNISITAFYNLEQKNELVAIIKTYRYFSGHFILCKFLFAGYVLEFLTGVLLIFPKTKPLLVLSHRLFGMCVFVLAAFSALTGYQTRKFMIFEVDLHQYYYSSNIQLNFLQFGIVVLMVATYIFLAVDQFRDLHARSDVDQELAVQGKQGDVAAIVRDTTPCHASLEDESIDYKYPAYTDEDFDVSCSSWTEYLLLRGVILALIPVTFFTGLYWPDQYDHNPSIYDTEWVGANDVKDHIKFGINGIFLGMVAVCITFRMMCLVVYKLAVALHVIFVLVVLVSLVMCHNQMTMFYSRQKDRHPCLIPYSTGHYKLTILFATVFIIELVTGFLMCDPKIRRYIMLSHKLGGLCVVVAASMSALTGYESRRFMFIKALEREYYYVNTRTINALEFGIVCLTVTINILLGHKNFRGSPNAQIVPDSIYR